MKWIDPLWPEAKIRTKYDVRFLIWASIAVVGILLWAGAQTTWFDRILSAIMCLSCLTLGYAVRSQIVTIRMRRQLESWHAG